MKPEPRRERKKARTRRSLYEAAFALFRERGYEAVTIDEICRSADVARGTFFQHFPGKAALLAEWERRLAADLARQLADLPQRPLAEARALTEWLGQRWPAQPDLSAALLAEQLRAAARGGGPLLEAVEAALRRGQERGALRRHLPARLAAWLLVSGTAARAAGAAGEGSLADPGPEALLQTLLSGLREPKPRVAWRPPAASRPS